jgi:DNA repair ATPase RecN
MPSPSASTASPHHRVLSLTIEGGVHFPSAHLEFADGLNSIVGPTGSGKTTLLQSLRFGTGAAATDPRADKNEAQATGTLGAGRVIARVETQHGQRYTSERRAGAPPRVTTEAGAHAPVSLDSDLFKIDFYAQNEIQAMADRPAAQLALLDKFAASEIRALEESIAHVEAKLALSAANLEGLETEIADAAEKTSSLPTVAAALEALGAASGDNADELRRAHEAKMLRGREQAALRGLRDDLRSVHSAANAFEVDARRRLGEGMAPALRESANRAALEQAHGGVREALVVLQDAVSRVRSALASAESGVTSAGDVLGAAHAGQEAAYEVLTRKLDADRTRLAERDRVQRTFLDLEALEKKAAERRREHATRSAEAQTLRDERARLIAMELGVRQRVAAEITRTLEGKLDVSILAGGDTSEYLALLAELVKGTGLRSELVKEIARNIRPDDLAALVRAGDPGPIQAIDEAKTNRAERAQKFLDALRGSGKLARLDAVRLRDVAVIRLRVDDALVPTTQLAFGQRCIAVLLILLIQSVSPLAIDQPEDQLDNAFVFDVFVPALHAAKKCRQIIFASHNPNIVVLGESDRVFVLEGKNSVGHVAAAGTLDGVRDDAEDVLEGGREAFLLRSQRYGHTP